MSRTWTIIVWWIPAIIATGSAHAQGTFQNLNFESARLTFTDPPANHVLATTNALPGWSASYGTNQLSTSEVAVAILNMLYTAGACNCQ